ncbi:hypothetical protein K432DRAFT_423505 [Lepidopterella palustris CBS 459.81]|uniref:Small ribosomal subunit protein uS5m n=1 Tax=Lepidopterella palustris CBS 459.81 TaxID=1314670 RepID=A0A8E2EFV2_9PEZI|nr:hypothetical protein K432DRAFT_423505 [Lepidopterella palustris CBS 459.81]
MSVCRPARCLLSKTSPLPKPSPHHLRTFHTTPCRNARRRPHYPNIKASDLNLLKTQAAENYPAYKPDDEALLAKKYTPSQIAAIKAAEAAIDPLDLVTQSSYRTDPWRLPYEDDLATVDPIIDHAPKLHGVPGNGKFWEATPAERDAAIEQVANEQIAKLYPNGFPENPSDDEKSKIREAMEAVMMHAYMDPRTTFFSDSKEVMDSMVDPRHSAVLQELPRIDSRVVRATATTQNKEEEDPRVKATLLKLGWTQQQLRQQTKVKCLIQHAVVNQTRMGKIRSMYYLSIAGNGNGLLGVGEGKSTEPEEGRRQSINAAIRNMKPIPRYEARTIYGEVEKKVGAVRVQLSSRPPGFGLRVQHLIFEMARLAGLQDLAARVPRSRNKMNVVKATWEALMGQKLPEDIARARGKKLVDVRRVYYGTSVH